MVRFKADAVICVTFRYQVSIPKWYDLKYQRRHQNQPPPQRFNSKMVRFKALKRVNVVPKRQCFNSKMVRFKGKVCRCSTNSKIVSIPKWYDLKCVTVIGFHVGSAFQFQNGTI